MAYDLPGSYELLGSQLHAWAIYPRIIWCSVKWTSVLFLKGMLQLCMQAYKMLSLIIVILTAYRYQ